MQQLDVEASALRPPPFLGDFASEMAGSLEELARTTTVGVALQRALPTAALAAVPGLAGAGAATSEIYNHYLELLAFVFEHQQAAALYSQNGADADAGTGTDTGGRSTATATMASAAAANRGLQMLQRVQAMHEAFDWVLHNACHNTDAHNAAQLARHQRTTDSATAFDDDRLQQLTILNSPTYASYLARSRSRRAQCRAGQASASFTCPDGGGTHTKAISGPIGESCTCDTFGLFSCGCDENSLHATCRTLKSKCTCPAGKRLDGCDEDDAPSGGLCGKCLFNEPGDFCNVNVASAKCKAGHTCLGGHCCHLAVKTARCNGCGGKGTTNAGFCVVHKNGYTGREATECARGFTFADPNDAASACVLKFGGGTNCIDSDQCSSNKCAGDKCCADDVDKNACTSCGGAGGACSACRTLGADPGSGCKDCRKPNFFIAFGTAGTTDISCGQVKPEGASCTGVGDDGVFGDNDAACQSMSCRGGKCCSRVVVEADDQTNQQCNQCSSDGGCAGCNEGYSLIDNQVCRKSCKGGEIPHGESDRRSRWLWAEPPRKESAASADLACAEVQQEQARLCTDGEFDEWKIEANTAGSSTADLYTAAECFDACMFPQEPDLYVCTRTTEGCSDISACPQCTPHDGFNPVQHNLVLAGYRYEYAFVQPGDTCSGQLQEQQCLNGGLSDIAAPSLLVGNADELHTELSCSPLCSAGCILDKELDESVCHPECNNFECCYQHGACSALMADGYAAARVAVFNDDTEEAILIFSELCRLRQSSSVVGDQTQFDFATASCQAKRSLKQGLDLMGRSRSFVDPLDWSEYNVVVEKYVEALVGVNNQIEKVTAEENQEEQFEVLRKKLALLELATNNLPDTLVARIAQINAKQSNALVRVESLVEELSDDQKQQFRDLQRQTDRVLLNQDQSAQQLERVQNKLLDSDQELLVDMTQSINNAKESIEKEINFAANLQLKGQAALMDAIEENAERLHELMLMQIDIKRSTLASQRLLEDMSAEYEAERAQLIVDVSTVKEQTKKIRRDNGWDYNLNGLCEETELRDMVMDLNVLEPTAVKLMEARDQLDGYDQPFQLTDVVGVALGGGNVRDRTFVKDKGINTILNQDADLDGDSRLSIVETLAVLQDTFCFFEGGIELVSAWRTAADELNVERMRSRHRRQEDGEEEGERNGNGKNKGKNKGNGNGETDKDGAHPVDAAWQGFVDKADGAVNTILGTGSKFSFAKVDTTIKRITGLINGIKSLAKSLQSTISSCASAITAIVGIFTGGLGGLFSGGGGLSKIGECISGIKDTISAVKNTFDATKNLMSAFADWGKEKTETVKTVLAQQTPAKKKRRKERPADGQNVKPDEPLQADGAVKPRKKKPKNGGKDRLPPNVKPPGIVVVVTTTTTTTTTATKLPADPNLPKERPAPVDSTGDDDCFDLNPKCADWAERGECVSKPDFMERNCRPSCRKCRWIDPATGRTCYRSKKTFNVRCIRLKEQTTKEPDPDEAFQQDVALQTAVANNGNNAQGDGDGDGDGGRRRFARAAASGDLSTIQSLVPRNSHGARLQSASSLESMKGTLTKIFTGEDVNADIKATQAAQSLQSMIKTFQLGASGRLTSTLPNGTVIDAGANLDFAGRVNLFASSVQRTFDPAVLQSWTANIEGADSKAEAANTQPPSIAEFIRALETSPPSDRPWTPSQLRSFLLGAAPNGSISKRLADLAAAFAKEPTAGAIDTFLRVLKGRTPTVSETHTLLLQLPDASDPSAIDADNASEMIAEITYLAGSLNVNGGPFDPSAIVPTRNFLLFAGREGSLEHTNTFLRSVDDLVLAVAGSTANDGGSDESDSSGSGDVLNEHIIEALATAPQQLPAGAFKSIAAFLWGLEDGLAPREKLVGFAREVGRMPSEMDASIEAAITSGPGSANVEQLDRFLAGCSISLSDSDLNYITTFVRALSRRAPDLNDVRLLLGVVERVATTEAVQAFIQRDDLASTIRVGDTSVVEDFVEALPIALPATDKLKAEVFAIGLSSGATLTQKPVEQFAERLGKSPSRAALTAFEGGVLASVAAAAAGDDAEGGEGSSKKGGSIIYEALFDLVHNSPKQLSDLGFAQCQAYIASLDSGSANLNDLETLALGLGKVFSGSAGTAFLYSYQQRRSVSDDVSMSLTGLVSTFVNTIAGSGRGDENGSQLFASGTLPTLEGLTEFMEALPDAYPTRTEVSRFVDSLGLLANAQNEFLRTTEQASQLSSELVLQTAITKSKGAALKGSLTNRRLRRETNSGGGGSNGGTCHIREAVSVNRLLKAQLQIQTQEVQGLQHRLLELVYQERRQLESKWLTDLSAFRLPGLESDDFMQFQAKLFDYNLEQNAALATSSVNERLVNFAVTRSQQPEQFAKLGVTSLVNLTREDGSQDVIAVQAELSFDIEAPDAAAWHGSYFTEVRVFFGPANILRDNLKTISIKITKGSNSLFLRPNGLKANAVTFEHTALVRTFDYFTADCRSATSTVTDSELIRYSPYGTWRLQLVSSSIDPQLLMQIHQVHFQFRIRHQAVALPPSVPFMFGNDAANDPEVYPDGIVIVREDAETTCPADVVYIPDALLPRQAGVVCADADERICTAFSCVCTSSEDSAASSQAKSSTVLGVLLPLLLIMFVVAGIYFKRMQEAQHAKQTGSIADILNAAMELQDVRNSVLLRDAPPPYLRGQISRQTAEAVLKNGAAGAFIVRDKPNSEDRVISVVLKRATAGKPAKFMHEVVNVPGSDAGATYGAAVYGEEKPYLIKGVAVGDPPATSLRELLVHCSSDASTLGIQLIGVDDAQVYDESGVLDVDASRALYGAVGEVGWAAGASDYDPAIYGSGTYGNAESYTNGAITYGDGSVYSVYNRLARGGGGGTTIYGDGVYGDGETLFVAAPHNGSKTDTLYGDAVYSIPMESSSSDGGVGGAVGGAAVYGGDTLYSIPMAGASNDGTKTVTLYGGGGIYSIPLESSNGGGAPTYGGDTLYAIPIDGASTAVRLHDDTMHPVQNSGHIIYAVPMAENGERLTTRFEESDTLRSVSLGAASADEYVDVEKSPPAVLSKMYSSADGAVYGNVEGNGGDADVDPELPDLPTNNTSV